ncbi:MAG: cobalamin-dependent protein [Candidatus Bathyarchaeia archaeon]
MGKDFIFLHPPSLIDFREKPWFPGPIARTVRSTPVFTAFPIGLISIADFLDRIGYDVKIVNVGERMLLNPKFNLEGYLEEVDAKIFGIDLHWCVHVQGALELARICKKVHPDSFLVLGGLTATCFNEEIIQKFPYVDAVVRGESEEALAKLKQGVEKCELDDVPNITYRNRYGKVKVNAVVAPPESLDNYEFTRTDLIEPPTQTHHAQMGSKRLKVWQLPICRGCLFNCVTCGGSAYSYKKLFSRTQPAFRSSEKILEDFQRLDEQGFNSVFLFQDVRMGGDDYWKNMFKILSAQRWSKIEHVTLELFKPPNLEFIKTLHRFKPADKVALTMSPESGVDHVRQAHGRDYTNESIIETAKSCLKLDLPITFFFMGVLAHETMETVKLTWKLWDRIFSFKSDWIDIEYGPMVILDPGSIAFYNPDKVGYRMRSRTLFSHYQAAEKPIWVDWINYETEHFDVNEVSNLILDSIERLVTLKGKYGKLSERVTELELKNVALNRLLIQDVKKIQEIEDLVEREKCLKELKEVEKDPVLTETYILTHE